MWGRKKGVKEGRKRGRRERVRERTGKWKEKLLMEKSKYMAEFSPIY